MTIKDQNIEWRKSRLAARLLIERSKRPLRPSRKVLAGKLSRDKGVSDRLIKQALTSFYARKPHSVCLD